MTGSTVLWCHSLVNERFNCLLMSQPCQWQVQLSFDVTALSMTGSTVTWCHSLVNDRFNCPLMSQPCQWQVQLHLMSQPCQWQAQMSFRGARWLSSRVSDSGARGPGFETYRRRVVSLSKTLYSPKVLVNYPGSDGSVPTWLKNCWLGS